MENKICRLCNIEKPLCEYFLRDKVKMKYHSECKICSGQKRRSKEHYEKYKKEYKQRAYKRNCKVKKENRIKLIEYFKLNPCIVCGETNPVVLDFDHRDDTKKSFAISAGILKKWEIILEEINKCDVLCANHHRIRTSKQLGWFYENL